jgi:hypothetical protein
MRAHSPEFMELARHLAMTFEQLTAAVDAAMHASPPVGADRATWM